MLRAMINARRRREEAESEEDLDGEEYVTDFDPTPRYVLLQVLHESQASCFQEDDWNEALTEIQMLEMLASKLGFQLVPKEEPKEPEHNWVEPTQWSPGHLDEYPELSREDHERRSK